MSIDAGPDGLAYAAYSRTDRRRRPEFDDHVKRVAELRAEIRRLRGAGHRRAERTARPARERRPRAAPGPAHPAATAMMAKLRSMIARDPAAALATMTEPLAEVRAHREALLEQRAIVEAAPRALAEAEADIERTVALAASKVPAVAGYFAARSTGYIDALHWLRKDTAGADISAINLLCAIAPDQVRGWLTGALHEHYRTLPASMSAEQRQAELARLDAEIAEVERQEVQLCWSLLDAGIEFEWRPDVRVELVLGLDPAPEPAP
jgi:hypothetical protein